MQYKKHVNFWAFEVFAKQATEKELTGKALYGAVFQAACLWFFEEGAIDIQEAERIAKDWIKDHVA